MEVFRLEKISELIIQIFYFFRLKKEVFGDIVI